MAQPKEKNLFEVKLAGKTSVFTVYVVAKNEEEAVRKAKLIYPYCWLTSCTFFIEIFI